jgi:hypothetical protein
VIEGPDRQFFGADDIIRIVHDHQQVSSRGNLKKSQRKVLQCDEIRGIRLLSRQTIWLKRGS